MKEPMLNLNIEKEYPAVLSELAAVRPETHFDERFSKNLRAKLLEKKAKPVVSPYKILFASRIFYSALGSVLTILIAVPLTFVATQSASPSTPLIFNPFQVKDSTAGLTLKQQINNKGSHAFGTLALLSTTTSTMATSTVADSTTAFLYAYEGDPMTLTNVQGTVFKKVGDYTINVNFESQNQSVVSATTTDAAISLASDFLKNHNVDMSMYDAPFVLGTTSNATTTVSIMYPLLIAGKQVYTSLGILRGAIVNVDLEKGKVLTIENLTSQVYDSSTYPVETSFDTILNVATSTYEVATSTLEATGSIHTAHLETPKSVLLQSGDLYVPALAFPIKYDEADVTTTLPTTVVVPLVKVL